MLSLLVFTEYETMQHGLCGTKENIDESPFDVKPTSNVGDVFQQEFEGHLLSLEGNLKCA
jgi:hypothetical protein